MQKGFCAREPECSHTQMFNSFLCVCVSFFSHSLVHILRVLSCKEERHNLRVAGLYSAEEKKNRRKWMLTCIAHTDLKTDLCRGSDWLCVCVCVYVKTHRTFHESSKKSFCLSAKVGVQGLSTIVKLCLPDYFLCLGGWQHAISADA